jgi:hypothetical protein
MQLNNLIAVEAKAGKAVRGAETRFWTAQEHAKAAKRRAQQTKLEYKRDRKSAKQARQLAAQAEARLRDQQQLLAEAEKRLSKAVKQARIEHSAKSRARRPCKQEAPGMTRMPQG